MQRNFKSYDDVPWSDIQWEKIDSCAESVTLSEYERDESIFDGEEISRLFKILGID